jgi:hypothetical protein
MFAVFWQCSDLPMQRFVRRHHRSRLGGTTLWTAPAERERRRRFGCGTEATENRQVAPFQAKAVSRFACHRSP